MKDDIVAKVEYEMLIIKQALKFNGAIMVKSEDAASLPC